MPCRAIQCWGIQVSLKWLTQQRIPVIPKTDTKQHLLENIDLFGWELSVDEMATLTRATSPPVMSDDRRAKSGARNPSGLRLCHEPTSLSLSSHCRPPVRPHSAVTSGDCSIP